MCVFHKTQHSFTLLHIPLLALTDRQNDRETNTLVVRGLEELRVNLLLKENSYVSNIILCQSLILELKFYKLYVLICIMFSSLVKRALLYKLFYELIFSNNSWSIKIFSAPVCSVILFLFSIWLDAWTAFNQLLEGVKRELWVWGFMVCRWWTVQVIS